MDLDKLKKKLIENKFLSQNLEDFFLSLIAMIFKF